MHPKPRIGVSACVLGEPVRYNGGHCRDTDVLPELAPHVDFVSVCPEVESGLGAPRESMRLVGDAREPRLVGGHSGRDETPRLSVWSRQRADSLASLDLDGFILKKGSPSCGMKRVRVYHQPGSAPSYDGVGIFARTLKERFPDMALEEDGRMHDPGLREHFVTRVFASHAWRGFSASHPSRDALASFHERYQFLLLAHDEIRAAELGRLAGSTSADEAPPEVLASYGALFLRALAHRPSRADQGRVMRRILQDVHDVTQTDRADLDAAIDEYRSGFVPLAVPARILRHHVHHEDEATAAQAWFAPWPEGIRLRTQITG